MKTLRGLEGVSPGDWVDPVCVVGVFDGVHRGHRQLLYELCVWARAVEGSACVITFDRHPLEVLRGVVIPEILTIDNRDRYPRTGQGAGQRHAGHAAADNDDVRRFRGRLRHCRHALNFTAPRPAVQRENCRSASAGAANRFRRNFCSKHMQIGLIAHCFSTIPASDRRTFMRRTGQHS